MIKKRINKTTLTVLGLLSILSLSAQVRSPFNGRVLESTNKEFSFIISGHFHGASTNLSSFPAATLLNGIDTINQLHPSFLMSLGDMFLDVNENSIRNYQVSLFNKLQMPLYNAVGNHDLSNGHMYEKVFGKTFYSFTCGNELFIILNTELNDGSIKNEQLDFLKNSVSSASVDSIKNVFIFSHRPVWSEENPAYSKLFKENTKSSMGAVNFETEIRPVLLKLAKPVYWVSGSLGNAPASFFYTKEEGTNLIFMQTAVRNLTRDAILKVTIRNEQILLDGISLTGEKLEPIENYNPEYWKVTDVPEQKFNYRLLPLLIKQMICHYYFWSGFVFSLICLFVFSFIKKRWKKHA